MKKDYKRCIEIIVIANENIVTEAAGETVTVDEDAMWDEFEKLRKTLSYKENQTIQRLLHSVGYVEPKDIEIDEADPGSTPHWLGPA